MSVHDEQGHKIEDWRVVADHGTERVRAAQYEPGDCEAWPESSGTSGRRGSGTTMRGAVTSLADDEGWSVREILAPDEKTREEVIAEAVRAEREACARICDDAQPAEYACRVKDDECGDREHSAMHSARLATLDAVAEAIRARST